MSQPNYFAQQSFTVPAGAGSYAPEEITFAGASVNVRPVGNQGLSAMITQALTAAVLEVWLLKSPELDPTVIGNWSQAYTLTAAGTGASRWYLDNWPGVKIRVKSGGTAGTVIASASAA